MNKKFNLLALAAAASACGALVLTSCGGSGKTHIVLFKTDGLKNILDANKPTPVSIKAQHVKDGKLAKSPIDLLEAAKKYARYTYKMSGSDLVNEPYTLKGWSESTEDEASGSIEYRSFDLSRPITGDTVLYPLYTEKKVHCLTIELKQDATHTSTWNEVGCNQKHIWSENWFETGTSLAQFKSNLESVINPAPNMVIDYWTYFDEDDNKQVKFDWETSGKSAVITEDLTLTAHYNTYSA